MRGLSITAIGMRSILECLEVFHILQSSLKLDYLELAIGSQNPVDFDYASIPLILHDSCLYQNNLRLWFNILHPKTWNAYVAFIASHDVRAVSIHPPLSKDCTRKELEQALSRLEQTLQVPVYVEVMPSSKYWCSSLETLVEHPLLVDVSHILIWLAGDRFLTQQTCLSLLSSNMVGEIHLSHNQGFADTHDLIPTDIWFSNWLDIWSKKYFVTFESLPIEYAAFERLDKHSYYEQ